MRVIQLYEDGAGKLHMAQIEDGVCVALLRDIDPTSGAPLVADLAAALRDGMDAWEPLALNPEADRAELDAAVAADDGTVLVAEARDADPAPAIAISLDIDAMRFNARRYARLDG
jgi:hypothetical protein